jgi:hypothetical protein
MKKKDMNKPTRPTNRQINNNKAREKGLLVGWMTRAVVHGDASTLGIYIYIYIYAYTLSIYIYEGPRGISHRCDTLPPGPLFVHLTLNCS